MNTEQLVDYLGQSDKTANDLLYELNPKLEKRFEKACRELAKVVNELRVKYPDASIYVEEDTPLLLLGDSHSKHTPANNGGLPQMKMVACGSMELIGKIDGGGW